MNTETVLLAIRYERQILQITQALKVYDSMKDKQPPMPAEAAIELIREALAATA